MKIIVTGGAGFIGSHIVDRYIDMGHDVCVIDDLSTGQKKFLHSEATFYQIDLRDTKAILDIFDKEKPEIVNHHAAQMDVRKSVADPYFDAEVNILGLLNIMEAGRKNGLQKVIFASSGGTVYGNADLIPTPEDYEKNPASPYGVSKLTSEYYLSFYEQTYGIRYAVLRYGNVYGPRQNPHGEAGVVAIFTQKLLKDEQPVINGDGEQSRDFVFVDDVVGANVKALTNRSIIVNIGTGKATTVNQIFDTLIDLTGKNIKRTHGEAKKGEQRTSVLDVGRAGSELGWKAEIELKEGLSKTVDFFKNET